ncbi:hypothetical protein Snoj_04460 [Streptomyces nojiriensis]|uniref:Rad50/SbcC-type AAA domain-containing protein n=1 Tax=Streptomyces nojiriensis TaxID=66374 RepID=A0ABQ3SEI4_9ACTN|nr:hypothetical protein [Streptomyces nojiriensis]QTI48178.1 Chromosome partition protein Smc [Streptomyces nojiriensis]GGS25926.1 hypothetical protein GCM10010205_64930 [Streptomyces nojiriensis]GHI66528.1 hypothetical protein Snoj_04460 [Streptomyces nojiriensis]
MSELQLTHLTYCGANLPPAQIVFGRELTVIYGTSDTGKSFIVKSIEYMLGGADLAMVPEGNGYTQILLGLLMPDGSPLTLLRAPDSNSIFLYQADLRDLVMATPDASVTAVHNARSRNSLSIHLLRALGLDEVLIRKNEAGGTRPLALSDLLHLSLVTEKRMIGDVPPVLRTGTASTRTAELSVMRFLVTGEGDPAVDTGLNAGQRRVHKGQVQLLDQLVLDLSAKLVTQENERQLRDRLIRIRTALDEQSAPLRQVNESHREAVDSRMETARELAALDERLTEVSDLLGRFKLLEAQYRSDLERLAMVNEAGSILGYFKVGTCPFCGAEREHQQANHRVEETTQLHIAVQAEAAKTTALLADLLPTIADLDGEQTALISRRVEAQSDIGVWDQIIADLEGGIAALRSNVEELVEERSIVERELELQTRIAELDDKKSRLVGEGAVVTTRPTQHIPTATVGAFDSILQQTLNAWQVPAADHAEYDQYYAEIRAGGRKRIERGKGMRSVLHSAFTTALARFCMDRDLHHLGFVVLDSPVVTFRDPEPDDIDDVELTSTVVDRFYKDMLSFPGQAIIMENGDPPTKVLSEAVTYHFTGTASGGRAGFFPASMH